MHPTAAAHELFGQAGFAGLQAAAQAGTIPVAILSALRQQSISLENRLNPTAFAAVDDCGKSTRRKAGDIDKFFSVEGGFYGSDAEQVRPGLSATTQIVKAGADMMVAENALIGFGVSLDHGQLDFDGDRGGFDSRLFIGAVYGQLALSKSFYLNAAAAAGHIDLYDIERSFLLGASREQYNSESEGTYYMGRVGCGFLNRAGEWIFNPAFALSYEPVTVDGYTESFGAASLSYGETEIEALRFSPSMTVTHAPENHAAWRKIFRASLEYDLKDNDLIVPMGPTADALGFVTAPRPDRGYGFLSAQFVKPLTGQSSFAVSGSSVVAQNGSTGWTAGLTYKLNY